MRARRGKYNAQPGWRCLDCGASAVTDGARCAYCKSDNVQRFDSKAEAGRFDELRMLRLGGRVSDVECQPKYPLDVNGTRCGHYIADFRYTDENGRSVVEDVKGGTATDTAVSKLKRKLVKAIHGIDVQVVRR